jgi:metal-sulfur cluster biosynthetic enzyme
MKGGSELRGCDRDREVYLASRIGRILNERDGSDLYAVPGAIEPEDAALLSYRDPKTRISVQVVSTPGQPHIRFDNKNLRNFERSLTARLRERGVESGHFSVSWTNDAVRYGLCADVFEDLADLIRSRMPPEYGTLRLRAEEDYELHPWLADAVNWINGLRIRELSELTVTSPTGCYLPRDGRWIADAVNRKVKRYGKVGCADVTLLVDGGNYVDGQQLAEFAATFTASECPFAHLWVLAIQKMTQLK